MASRRKKSSTTKTPRKRGKTSKPKTRQLFGYQRDGEWVIEPRFEKAEPFHHGLAAVRLGQKWGFCDASGELVIEPRFEGAYAPGAFADGNFMGLGGIDRTGQLRFRQREQAAEGMFAFNEGGIQAWDGKWGFRDVDTGEVVIPAQFTKVTAFYGDYAGAMKWFPDVGGRWGLIDRGGSWALEPNMDYFGCKGVDERGGIFSLKRDERYLTGAVHPIRGEVEPFEERNLIADRSRLDPVWPPSKPRTPADEALVAVGVAVPVPTDEPPLFPFRFYGLGLLEGGEPDYRVRFAEGVDVAAAASALRDLIRFDGAPFAVSTEVDGSFVRVAFDEPPEFSHEYEGEFVPHFQTLHSRFAIVEIVNLRPGIETTEHPWETWSYEQRPTPDDGPLFGARWAWD